MTNLVICPRCGVRERPAGRNYCRVCLAELAVKIHGEVQAETPTCDACGLPVPDTARGCKRGCDNCGHREDCG